MNTFALLPPESHPRTIEEEIEWIKENYYLDRPLIIETLVIALKQRIRASKSEKDKEFWKQVINGLKKENQ
jgi:hypothetical protein